jgi:hypothetical protein
MNFTISGEDFTFTLLVDPNGTLTSFTATKDSTDYDCSIQVTATSSLMPDIFCCTPSGCTSGSCSA